MPFNANNGYVFAKLETTYGTDASPGTADLIPCFGPSFSTDADFATPRPYRGDRSSLPTRPKSAWAALSFSVPMAGSGTSGVAPRWARLLRACGYAQTTEGGKAVFLPVSTADESISLYYIIGTKRHRILGARGSFSISAEAGGGATVSFSFKGLFADPETVTAPTITWPTEPLAPIVQNAQLSRGATSIICSKFSFDAGNTVTAITSADTTFGYRAFRVTDRSPSGSIDPEFFVEESFWTDYTDAVTSAFQIRVGTTLGNQVSMSGSSSQVTRAGYEERDSLRTFGLSLAFRRGLAGNDEFKLLFD